MKKVKVYKPSDIITDVATNWRQMAGKNLLEKKINAFITASFVMGRAPKDECIYIAQRILKLKVKNEANIREELRKSFGQGVTFNAQGEKREVNLDKGSTALHLDKGASIIFNLIRFS